MDTTYWGRGFGLMVIKDAYRNKILWRKYVRYETIAGYLEGVSWLKEHGFRIYGVVIDGLRGLAEALRTYPVRHCQFHQMMSVRHYRDMTENEGKQLDLFVRFLQGNKWDKYLRTLDWKEFARHYNGPSYAQNQYDTK